MKNTKVLEMINQGRIEELKAALHEEIYTDALKSKPNAKKRYTAMKKYFTYMSSARDILQKPCPVEYNEKQYTSFTNGHSLALTTDSCELIDMLGDTDRYPDVTRLIRDDGTYEKIYFGKIFADAKSKGYSLKKSELDGHKYKYLMRYNGAYFKLGLVDATFAIIDDGEEANVYHNQSNRSPITIKTSVGVCTVMPMNIVSEDDIPEVIIIDVKGDM